MFVTRASARRFSIGLPLAMAAAAFIGASVRVAGEVYTNTGSDSCVGATVVPVPVGPVGSPTTVTIFGNNAAATAGDGCSGPLAGAVWWEAFQITQEAIVKLDLCSTSPSQTPGHNLLVLDCPPGCPYGAAPDSGYGAPICGDGNFWIHFAGLPPGTYYYPLRSSGTTGPYEMHISAQSPPPLNSGPDVITAELVEVLQLGREGTIGEGVVGLGVGTTDCNVGDEPFTVLPLPDIQHALIHANMYRLSTAEGANRFEQIGQSWIKHTFGAFWNDDCELGCNCLANPCPVNDQTPRCSDTYYAVQFEPCSMGPRSAIHPYTNVMPFGPDLGPGGGCEESFGGNYPATNHIGHDHPGFLNYAGIDHRLQARDVDLLTSLNPGARYFVEAGYMTPDEFALGNGNQHNNLSHREYAIGGPDSEGVFSFTPISATFTESPAIDAWTAAQQVIFEPFPGADGRAILAYQVTDNNDGTWHYEYAMFNMNLDASIRSFGVPVPSGVVLTEIGFHAPPQHPPILNGDNYSSTPWTGNIFGGVLTWSTDTFAVDPLVNAVRYGTAYNFRFDANASPTPAPVTIGLFKTGGSRQITALGPGRPIPAASGWTLMALFLAIAAAGGRILRTRMQRIHDA